MDGTILIADDDRTIRTVLTQAFSRAGCKVHATSSLNTLLRWVGEGRGDLVISDVVMPDGNGLEQIPEIGRLRPDLPVIVISAQNTIMTAIRANEVAAYDYLPKPFDLPDLMKRAARALIRKRPQRPEASHGDDGENLPLIGRTPAMQEVYRLVARILNTDMPVLIMGESGTGKSLIARVIHEFSDRRSLPMVTAGASDLEDIDAVHAILAKAKTGSVLFDEIADLTPEAQARLVRNLDALGENAPRLMATTQRDLGAELAEGRFRSDLFYRLSAFSLSVPPLRSRIDDIPLLAAHFLARIERDGGENKGFAREAIDQMLKYHWPGNVRQLENLVRRLAVTVVESSINAVDVLAALGPADPTQGRRNAVGGESLSQSIAWHLNRYFSMHGDLPPPGGLYARILREMEMPLLDIALEATGGNQAKCAELLGINRNTLRKKLNELDIRVTRRRKLM
ncbi:MAG: response regulator [Rhodobacteraceae bacterium]|nr:response regulator [Paracoccaceae bacterium]